jgi:hypothetical protein
MARFTRRQRGGETALEKELAKRRAAKAEEQAAAFRPPPRDPEQEERERQENEARMARIIREREAVASKAAAEQAALNARAAEIAAIRESHKHFTQDEVDKIVAEFDENEAFSFVTRLKKSKTPVVRAALIQKLTSMSPASFNKLKGDLDKRGYDEELVKLNDLQVTPTGVNSIPPRRTVFTPESRRIFNQEGYNQDGYDMIGRNRGGWNREGINVFGQPKPEPYKGESNEHYTARMEKLSLDNKLARESFEYNRGTPEHNAILKKLEALRQSGGRRTRRRRGRGRKSRRN